MNTTANQVVKVIYVTAPSPDEALDKLPAKFNLWKLLGVKKCGRKFEIKVARTFINREVAQ